MNARFGPAGSSERYNAQKHKSSLEIPPYLREFGLDHFEYQCGRGVNVGEEKARAFGKVAAENGITVSLHSPYYISLASVEEEKRLHSIDYILQSARAVDWMGGIRVVVHSGTCGKISRAEAMEKAKDTLIRAQAALDAEGLSHIRLCPETMGKINQLGDLEEVMQLCELEERFLPCLDFGHLNARTLGGIRTTEDFAAVLDTVQNRLGSERASQFHAHFSKIEYTAGGEKRHLTFEDTVFGPDFSLLAPLLAQRGWAPVIVCESAGTQDDDALQMKQCYREALR